MQQFRIPFAFIALCFVSACASGEQGVWEVIEPAPINTTNPFRADYVGVASEPAVFYGLSSPSVQIFPLDGPALNIKQDRGALDPMDPKKKIEPFSKDPKVNIYTLD